MKQIGSILLAAAIVATSAAGAGGSSGDPLVTQSYLEGTYAPTLLTQAQQRADRRTQALYDQVLQEAGLAGGFGERRYKQGDVLTLSTGSGCLLLAGEASVRYASGAVVDVTGGTVVPSGSALEARHRYLAAENTTAVLSVSSATAVLSLEGSAALSPSASTDYNALADALSAMGLFAGTGTAYGSGYDLERAATRVEGLVLFLRLLGEEAAAQAYTGPCPFSDVPEWAQRYVAYAYDRGYTAGVGTDAAGNPAFGPAHIMDTEEYVTFLLRALGYQDSGESPDFTWQSALPFAQEQGVLTGGEVSLFSGLPSFLRAHAVYLSYFALDAPMKDGSGTLLASLSAAGALDGVQAQAVRAQVTVSRIS